MKNRAIALIITMMVGAGLTVYNYTGESITLPNGTVIETSQLLEHETKHYAKRALKNTDSLTIWVHHTAVSSSASIEAINNYHVKHNGWPRIAYHSAIEPDGDILILNHLSTISYHTKNQNTKGISIVLLGNYNEDEITQKQLKSLKQITEALCTILPIKAIKGHRDSKHSNTTCPGNKAYKKLKHELFFNN
ncbi:N-acetylmuramoyl-L-alanine amidase [Algibacter sp. PT7-4]|uniref:peptidoglycan recognition protein family protein n=1 Tax=Algibacter ulvanivorans TaxID=3400999 RepID=UPI003AAD29B4